MNAQACPAWPARSPDWQFRYNPAARFDKPHDVAAPACGHRCAMPFTYSFEWDPLSFVILRAAGQVTLVTWADAMREVIADPRFRPAMPILLDASDSMYGRRLDCDSPEGRLICDEVVPPHDMDRALDGVIEGLTNSGVVSAVSNRRAFRIGQEPLDLFRRYLALYAREQAFCHFSPALIANLERYWNAMQRKA